jgi:hypothetical protein
MRERRYVTSVTVSLTKPVQDGWMNTNNAHQFLAYGVQILRRMVLVSCLLGKEHFRDQSGIDRKCIQVK